jgi:hypothetical protein
MAQIPVVGPFRLVYLAFNSLLAVLSQLARSTASAMSRGRWSRAECSSSSASPPDKARSGQDQRITTQAVTLDEHGMRLRPVTLRYA